jgi:hypothetical protein
MIALEELEKLVKERKLRYFFISYCANISTPGSDQNQRITGYQSKAIRFNEHAVLLSEWDPTLEKSLERLLSKVKEEIKNNPIIQI